ncbi:DISARM system helicase DrmA [Azospirillum sp. HJ39]|uniref:DISARM system helicase DrmA n=1 Tax=Azospirillum sp. HJ39 TaxID=3159496 RepID=UPI0035588F6F
MTTSADVRAHLVTTLRRDLVGPGPEQDDEYLSRERLSENPSRWYLTGFLAPSDDAPAPDDPQTQEERDIFADLSDDEGAAADEGETEAPSARRRFLPSSIGLTVLLAPEVTDLQAVVSWGDYVTEPPLPPTILLEPAEDRGEDGGGKKSAKPKVEWVRVPRRSVVRLPLPDPDGRGAVIVPDSAAAMMAGGGMELQVHARTHRFETPDGPVTQRAVTVFLINRRPSISRLYADVTYAFQARLDLHCDAGFLPRHDLSGYRSPDDDLRVADLHYRDVEEYAVGRNTAATWVSSPARPDGAQHVVRQVHTDPLPLAEVERVAPNLSIDGVEFGMRILADLAESGADALAAKLAPLPPLYCQWIDAQRERADALTASRRRETAETLLKGMADARDRIADGIDLLRTNDRARLAFRLMNLAVERAARRRIAGPSGDPDKVGAQIWRPFQLAFILLNLRGLVEKGHPDREVVDLLFFPTGGGKTEAYLGLAAFAIAHRRLSASGVLGAGVTVVMRYTLRLLTLDQLSRAAGVVCALELMRTDPTLTDGNGRPLLGDWPIEIGLWVGSDASPNKLGGKGNTGDDTAVTRVRAFRKTGKRAPAPIKACPWCGTAFGKESFACVPNDQAPHNMEVRCVNPHCDFTGNRPLPLLTVDEPIYRRLPAFLIATVDKFASLPWVGASGAFFGHVDRFQPGVGFLGAAEPKGGERLYNGWTLDPPDLIIQDELHLISGPLGTVAGLYETAIDRLATRGEGSQRIRPKVIASTATVRRAAGQIRALFDRERTEIFPPPGIERTDSFFAQTVHDADNPPRWYLGLAAQGRGPKLVFLRGLTTLLAAAAAAFEDGGPGPKNPADPYMTALCYFNALRELGGARRIVEDEVRDRAGRYGTQRRRLAPADGPFQDRRIGEPLELTSRVSTDQVAEAKRRLERVFGEHDDTVDVALATNMISVGLDITRLGLMLVQGQPKTAAEYIQATSRVGRDPGRPGLVVTVLNLHKPRDRMHYEQFCQFHRSFYRAVEATSVTPWAARALDRALAAIVVALTRHLDPALTPELAVRRLKDMPDVRRKVRDAIVERAPGGAVAGGRAHLAALIDSLLDDWIRVADEQTASGSSFAYVDARLPRRLLHAPLDPAAQDLPDEHRRFVAGRSMRDVEPNVLLKLRDPWGNPIKNADDAV